jgi:hypothetical protein
MNQLSFFGYSPKKVSWVSSFASAKGCLFLVAAIVLRISACYETIAAYAAIEKKRDTLD